MTRAMRWLSLIALCVVMGAVPVTAEASRLVSAPQQGTNLLTNPGFEGLTCPGSAPSDTCKNYTHDTHLQDGLLRNNIETPEGWVTWWQEGDGYAQPEVVLMPASNPSYTGNPVRIRSGFRALKVFTYSRIHNAGLYQVVTGLQPGATVRLSVYAHSWSCGSMQGDSGWATTCGDPWNTALQVGIEPNGLRDPFSPTIVWSAEQWSPDVYRLIGPVTATVGPGGAISVYLRSKTKWPMTHNDVYWDDAALTYASAQPAPTAIPAAPAPTSPAAPAPTGAVVHVVQRGDTLYGIARRYGVDMWAIVSANGIVNPSRIYVGQRLTIASTTTPPATPEPQATPAPAPSEGAPSGGVYIVQPGENLYRIGLRFGVSVSAIARANGIANPNLIRAGQRLIIPGATP